MLGPCTSICFLPARHCLTLRTCRNWPHLILLHIRPFSSQEINPWRNAFLHFPLLSIALTRASWITYWTGVIHTTAISNDVGRIYSFWVCCEVNFFQFIRHEYIQGRFMPSFEHQHLYSRHWSQRFYSRMELVRWVFKVSEWISPANSTTMMARTLQWVIAIVWVCGRVGTFLLVLVSVRVRE